MSFANLGAQASRLHAGGTPALPAPVAKDLSHTAVPRQQSSRAEPA